MTDPHISVCVCTYKRPTLLKRLLEELARQETDGLFSFSVVIVDNDREGSAATTTSEFTATGAIPVRYCVEPQQNIALARNKAIAVAEGDYIAFIDDDEFPTPSWLLTLFRAMHHYGVDGVLGPVKPHFDVTPPRWVVQGKFYDRPSYPTGSVIDWRKGRTGNVLLKRHILPADNPVFRSEFRVGEDQDLFRRLIENGHVFIWCHEATAYEVVTPVRWNRTFLLRRSLLRGASTLCHPTFGWRDIVTSLIAIPAYMTALPIALVMGQGRFMLLLVKLFDHLGRLLALVGTNPVAEPYVTDESVADQWTRS